jgi:hypothetical protein
MKNSPNSSAFDKVHRDPVNKIAAMMFSRGVKAPSANMGDMTHWETCPPLHTKSKVSEICKASGKDLTGMRLGRMTVVGLSSEISARWIMRCDCGDYEPRKAKSIKNPNNSNDCCVICRKIDYAKRKHYYHMTGKDL